MGAKRDLTEAEIATLQGGIDRLRGGRLAAAEAQTQRRLEAARRGYELERQIDALREELEAVKRVRDGR